MSEPVLLEAATPSKHCSSSSSSSRDSGSIAQQCPHSCPTDDEARRRREAFTAIGSKGLSPKLVSFRCLKASEPAWLEAES
jgi:hypothetical protein